MTCLCLTLAGAARAQGEAGAPERSLVHAPAESASAGSIASPDSAAATSDSAVVAAPAPPRRDYLAEIRAAFTGENRDYADRRAALELIEPLYAIAVSLLLLFTGLAAKIRDIAEALGRHRYVHVLVYLAVYSLIAWVLSFPLAWYSGFALEHQFGLSTQSFGGWIADELKGQAVIVTFLGVLPLLALAYRTIEKNPRGWWYRFALATLPIVLFFTLIEPVAIDPIFNRFTPLRDTQLKTEILDLAARAGIPGRRVYEVDQSTKTTKYNAYVNGFGASQRIVIWDTTLKGMTHDEILFVVGHEMGHYVLGHVWKGIAVLSLGSFALFWLCARMIDWALRRWGARWKIRSAHDVASMPLLAGVLTLVSLFAQPLVNAYSRRSEHEADLFGLEVTQLNDAAARAFIKLGSQNRSNPEPTAWLRLLEYTHPPLVDRVRTALEYHPWTEGKPNRFFHGRNDAPLSGPGHRPGGSPAAARGPTMPAGYMLRAGRFEPR
ncbi:MAG TPA: M48 family metallopeptidase [Candidatus Udaeobacter sp.]|nr:M48 family metallopeptidase [Candidatus Udaeobacter sp.]